MFLGSTQHGATPDAEIANESGLRVEHDAAHGLLRVIGLGVWEPATADRHFAGLETKLVQIRKSGVQVRVLVDLRRSGPQPPATMDRLRHWTGQLYQPGDRVAIILASSLAKVAMRGVASKATRELFLSDTAAYKWLMAYA